MRQSRGLLAYIAPEAMQARMPACWTAKLYVDRRSLCIRPNTRLSVPRRRSPRLTCTMVHQTDTSSLLPGTLSGISPSCEHRSLPGQSQPSAGPASG